MVIQEDFYAEMDGKIKYRLENFEGPLDLLLFLIKGAKLDIKEVKLAEITHQYLEYMRDLDNIDMDRASEFIEMAATLLEIKSKSLLPKPEVVNEEEDEESKLKQRLIEYKIFKEITEKLKVLDTPGRFYKQPETLHAEKIVLKDFSYEKLLDAFSKMLSKAGEKENIIRDREIELDKWTVPEKISAIKDTLSLNKKIAFSSLFSENAAKSEIITTFLAVLELLKRAQIRVIQNELFSEIEIEKNTEFFESEETEETDEY